MLGRLEAEVEWGKGGTRLALALAAMMLGPCRKAWTDVRAVCRTAMTSLISINTTDRQGYARSRLSASGFPSASERFLANKEKVDHRLLPMPLYLHPRHNYGIFTSVQHMKYIR